MSNPQLGRSRLQNTMCSGVGVEYARVRVFIFFHCAALAFLPSFLLHDLAYCGVGGVVGWDVPQGSADIDALACSMNQVFDNGPGKLDE